MQSTIEEQENGIIRKGGPTNMSQDQQKENKQIFLKNPKYILSIAAVIIIVALCAFFKYKALVPIIILLVALAAIIVNRRILRKRKERDSEEVSQYALADNEVNKLAQYFVNRDEKYISSLGNGYIMNYLANGSLNRGFAVISNKRVYFRGSCLSGQGKSLVKTDEERTVDIKDVTGSGFIYRRYIGVLLGLFAALVTLIGGIGGSALFLSYEWSDTKDYQQRADEAQDMIDRINDGEKQLSNINEQIAAYQTSIGEAQDKIAELNELRTQELTNKLPDKSNESYRSMLLEGTGYDIFFQYIDKLYYCVTDSNWGFLLEESGLDPSDIADAIVYHFLYSTYSNVILDNDNLYVSPDLYLENALECLEGLDWERQNDGSWHRYWDDYSFDITQASNDLNPSFTQAYMDFVDEINPYFVDNNTLTEYDSEISDFNTEIMNLNASISALETEAAELRELQNRRPQYEQNYNDYQKKASSSFSAASFAAIAAGLLVTFLISCFLVFLDYLKKRKTMFQIQYAGGCIAFNVSYYAKAEIDDFQKQLRRTKDLAEESATKIAVTESPVQPSAQSSVPDDLRKYADLLKDGLISQEEYDAMKKKILDL